MNAEPDVEKLCWNGRCIPRLPDLDVRYWACPHSLLNIKFCAVADRLSYYLWSTKNDLVVDVAVRSELSMIKSIKEWAHKHHFSISWTVESWNNRMLTRMVSTISHDAERDTHKFSNIGVTFLQRVMTCTKICRISHESGSSMMPKLSVRIFLKRNRLSSIVSDV